MGPLNSVMWEMSFSARERMVLGNPHSALVQHIIVTVDEWISVAPTKD